MNTKRNRGTNESVSDGRRKSRTRTVKFIPNSEVLANSNPTATNYPQSEHRIREMQFYWELVVCKNLEDFKQRILGLLKTWSFSDFSYGIVGEDKESAGMVKYEINSQRIITSLKRNSQLKIFTDDDLVVQHARINSMPLFQSAISDYIANAPFVNQHIKRNLEQIRRYRESGYHDSYNIPVVAERGGNGLFSVTTKDMPRIDFQALIGHRKAELLSLALAVDYVGRIKFPEYLMVTPEPRRISVNPRPMALLTTLATENLSLKEAAKDLNISIHTANKHVAAVKKALGAKTQAAAVFTAIKEGLITFKY